MKRPGGSRVQPVIAMKRLLVPILLPACALMTAAAIVKPVPKRPAADPLNVLVVQLHRRFSDTRDVDFGFSRIARPKARMHFGPTMERNDTYYSDSEDGPVHIDPKRVRKNANGDIEIVCEDGTWIELGQAKEQMRPENAIERRAIGTLVKDRREVAIYTFGAFLDGTSNRRNGPAYLRQKGPEAPPADAVRAAAELAWRGGQPTLVGYRLHAEKIFAEASCVKCHNEMRTWDPVSKKARSNTYRRGDALGLLIIAEKL